MTLPIAVQDKAALAGIQQHLPHALIIEGEEGLATREVAEQIAANTPSDIIRLTPEDGKSTISTEQVRDLTAKLRTYATVRRVIIIDPADAMTESAQNALLKALEEPGAQTHFLLVTSRRSQLLATIQSRCQSLVLHRTSPAQDAALLADTTLTPAERQQLLFLAAGRPALLHRLIEHPTLRHEHISIATDAKQLLASPRDYEALCCLQRYHDRSRALILIETMLAILRWRAYHSPTAPIPRQQIDRLLDVQSHLRRNGHVRMCLLQLVV